MLYVIYDSYFVYTVTESFSLARAPIYWTDGRLTPKTQTHGFGCYNTRIALKFDSRLGNSAPDVSVKCQSDWKSVNPNLATSNLREILQPDVCPLSE